MYKDIERTLWRLDLMIRSTILDIREWLEIYPVLLTNDRMLHGTDEILEDLVGNLSSAANKMIECYTEQMRF